MTRLVPKRIGNRVDLARVDLAQIYPTRIRAVLLIAGLLINLLLAGLASAESADSGATNVVRAAPVVAPSVAAPVPQSFRQVSVYDDVFKDLVLTDETGQPRRIYQDLAKDHVLVLNFIFTTCTTICMPMGAMYASLQSEFGDRPIRLISITVDPERDTPSRLAAWKSQFHGGPNWTLLTGSKRDIDGLGKRLGVYASDRFSHVPTLVLIDDLRSRSTRMSALVPASAVIAAIDRLSAASPTSDLAAGAGQHKGLRHKGRQKKGQSQ